MLIATAIGATWVWAGPERAAVLAAIFALLSVVFGLFGWARASAAASSTPEQIDLAAIALLREVEDQWRKEAGRRSLTDPKPLAVHWRPSRQPVADYRKLTGAISGRSDEVAKLADRFLCLPHRRLVVLGEPGAGKTSLAVLLTLELCRRCDPQHGIVPFLLSAGSWDPDRESLWTWVERQLNLLHPSLRASDYGPAATRGLLTAGRVMPVIDGLSDMVESRRGPALRRLNEALREGGPLVATCRTRDYRTALEQADVLTATAVIEAEPLRIDDASEFLRQAVRPASPAAATWKAFLAAARRAPDGPLGEILSSPLMVWLVRAIYAGASEGPRELMQLGDRAAIRERLLSGVVPALFGETPAAGRWLSFLATHLDRQGTRDLAWWRLHREVPLLIRMVAFGLVLGLLGTASARLVPGGHPEVLTTIVLGLVFGLLGLFHGLEGRARTLRIPGFVLWPASGLGVGLVIAGFGLATRDWHYAAVAVGFGLAAGLGTGLADALLTRAVPALPRDEPWHSLGPGLAVSAALALFARFGPPSLLPWVAAAIGLSVWLAGALVARYLGHASVKGSGRNGVGIVLRSVAVWSAITVVLGIAAIGWALVDVGSAGLVYGALLGLLVWPEAPGRATLRVLGQGPVLLRALAAVLCGVPLLAGIVVFGASAPNTQVVLIAALIVLPPVVAIAAIRLIQTPVAGAPATDPATTLRDDRTLAILLGPVIALLVGPTVGALLAAANAPVPYGSTHSLAWLAGNLPTALEVGLMGGLVALAFGLGRPWPSYAVARAWLALRGRLPWRLMLFLEEAQRLGVLCQSGPYHQFRHAELQDCLAARTGGGPAQAG